MVYAIIGVIVLAIIVSYAMFSNNNSECATSEPTNESLPQTPTQVVSSLPKATKATTKKAAPKKKAAKKTK